MLMPPYWVADTLPNHMMTHSYWIQSLDKDFIISVDLKFAQKEDKINLKHKYSS